MDKLSYKAMQFQPLKIVGSLVVLPISKNHPVKKVIEIIDYLITLYIIIQRTWYIPKLLTKGY